MLELGQQLHPDNAEAVASAFLALRNDSPSNISASIVEISRMEKHGVGRPGILGRFLFPDQQIILRILRWQLEIRLARQTFIYGLKRGPSVNETAHLLEKYFDTLLAWNNETGWNKMISLNVWQAPIYEDGVDLQGCLYPTCQTYGGDIFGAKGMLKLVLAQGNAYTSYAQV